MCLILKLLVRFFFSLEFQVKPFGSTANGLLSNESDMDLTVLFTDYFQDNELKQQKVPKVKAQKLKEVAHNSSDSNSAELDESIDLDDCASEENNSIKNASHDFFVRDFTK